jgi:hypothetical protein
MTAILYPMEDDADGEADPETVIEARMIYGVLHNALMDMPQEELNGTAVLLALGTMVVGTILRGAHCRECAQKELEEHLSRLSLSFSMSLDLSPAYRDSPKPH